MVVGLLAGLSSRASNTHSINERCHSFSSLCAQSFAHYLTVYSLIHNTSGLLEAPDASIKVAAAFTEAGLRRKGSRPLREAVSAAKVAPQQAANRATTTGASGITTTGASATPEAPHHCEAEGLPGTLPSAAGAEIAGGSTPEPTELTG